MDDLHITENRDTHAHITQPRSPHWGRVEKEFLNDNPVCVCCGSNKKLNVHHKKPFHLFPELELEPSNLITLCMDNECHLLVGHGDNFRAYNPNVEEDAKKLHDHFSKTLLEEVAVEAKANRLFE